MINVKEISTFSTADHDVAHGKVSTNVVVRLAYHIEWHVGELRANRQSARKYR